MSNLEVLLDFIQTLNNPHPNPETIEQKISKFIDIANTGPTSKLFKEIGKEFIGYSKSAISANEKNTFFFLGCACLGYAESQATAERAAIAN